MEAIQPEIDAYAEKCLTLMTKMKPLKKDMEAFEKKRWKF
jgi:hypothetical protein